MKKFLVMATLIIGFIGCSKDENSEHYSKSQLEGDWYVIDIKRPNGNYASQSTGLEREFFECQKQYRLSFSQDNLRINASMPYYNGYGVSCNKQAMNFDYKIKGDRIEISEGKEKLEIYKIISLKDNRLEITFAEQMKNKVKEEFSGNFYNPTSLSLDDLLNSVAIFGRNSNGDSQSSSQGSSQNINPPSWLHGKWISGIYGYEFTASDICRLQIINSNLTYERGVCMRSFHSISGGKIEQTSANNRYTIKIGVTFHLEIHRVNANTITINGDVYTKK